MSDLHKDQGPAPDDILDRCLAALRSEGDEQGPSATVQGRVLAALRNASGTRPSSHLKLFTRNLHMTFTQKIAAAIIMTTGGLFLWFAFSIFTTLGGVSYGDVADQIRQAKTITYRMTVTFAGSDKPLVCKILSKEPAHVRLETSAHVVLISDLASGKSLNLMTDSKVATIISTTQPHERLADAVDIVSEFRNLANGQGKAIGERQIAGAKARGFELQMHAQTATVWADFKTGLPVLVEMSLPIAGQSAKVVLSDIVFDSDLDDSLFSLTPPASYKLESSISIQPPSDVETAVLGILRVYAKTSDGQFPPKLDDWGAFAVLASKNSTDGKLNADGQQLMGDAGALTGLLSDQKKGADYDYTPGTARLGDAGKLVFWMRQKEGTYRAIFGDLSVKNVTKEELSKP
jgi:outer membrane lipoprotein-sorting protein